jgi:hypothetical protein
VPVQAVAAAAAKKAAEKAARKAAAKVAEKTGGRNPALWMVTAFGLPVILFFGLVLVAFGIGSTPADASGNCGIGEAVPASADIPPSAMSNINALKADYEFVGQQEGISWSLLAAVDYRENGNDPNLSMLGGEPIGTAAVDSGQVSSSKRDSIIRGAQMMKSMASSVYGVDLKPGSGGDDVKKAVLAYNRGYIYQRAGALPDTSPYVMNQYDAAHKDMVWPSVSGEPLAGQTEYGRFGAFTLFTRLGGAAGNCGLSSDDIVRIAQQQLGLQESPDGCNCGDQIQKFLGSSPGEFWCADFVSWVYNEAGHPFSGGQDGGWRVANVSVMHDWLLSNGSWFDAGSPEDPKPGDVITFRDDDHVGIVEYLDDAGTPGNPNDDTVHTIEGNTTNMVARRTYGRVGDTITGWGRMKAAA